jgi:hypothetical protein
MLFSDSIPQADETELRNLAALLAWRRCAQKAVVPLVAMIAPPPVIPDFVLIERYPLIED